MSKKLKQIISLLLVSLITLSVFPTQTFAWTAPTETDWKELSRDGIQARFAVGSDIHIGYDKDDHDDVKYKNALNVFKTIDPQIDGVLVPGDLTVTGIPAEYDELMGIVKDSGLTDKMIWSMGNHEYYRNDDKQSAIEMFTAKTGQEPDKVTTPGGITVITLGSRCKDGDSYTGQYDFLKKALEDSVAKDPNKPIFVICHHGIKNTAYVTDEWSGDYGEGTDHDMVALMAKYPQVIHISGHSHSTVEVPTSIDQSKGFTCIQDSTVGAFFENESGKIDSDGTHQTRPEGSEDASQALIIDVEKDNSVIVRRLNLTSGRYCYEPWVINIPDLVAKNYKYTKGRAQNSKAPSFADDAKVNVDFVDTNSVKFSFTQGIPSDSSNDNMIQSYKMKVINTKTNEAIKDGNNDYYLRFADYYKATTASTLYATIKKLTPDTEYRIDVSALTPYNVESTKCISTTFRTKPERNVPTVISELISTKPEIDGNLSDSIWSVDKKIEKDMTANSTHNASFDVKYDNDNVYLAAQVKGDTNLVAGSASGKGDIVWVYLDPTIHASAPYATGDWQIGIGYNPVDSKKPYIIIGSGVTASDDVKKALTDSISAAAVATADGWNIEAAMPWSKLGIDIKAKRELGFDVSVDNCSIAKNDLSTLTWSGCSSSDTSGFGKIVLNKNILDVDFSDGTAKDKSPIAHTAVAKGNNAVVISDSSELGKKIASFNGTDNAYGYNLTAEDFQNIKNSFTMQCMVKIKDSKNGDIFMDCEGSGLGYELNADGKTLEFWAHINGNYSYTSVDISNIKTQWIHATETYDGVALKMYINGQLEQTLNVTGELDVPYDSARWMMIGSDTDSHGYVERPLACDVSSARVYSAAITADEVVALYTKDNPVVFTLSDNKALTGTIGEAVAVPTATAKDVNGACEVTVSVAGPTGENVAISSNTFTPSTAGAYTITYTANGQKQNKTVTVKERDSITGKVTDGTNPVTDASVSVSLNGKTYTATTASDGKYVLSGVPSGKGYTVTASKSGYVQGSALADVTASATTSNIDIILKPVVFVKSVVVRTLSGTLSVNNGSSLQMEAEILPQNASNQAVTWSVVNGTGSATISSTGLLTATGSGTVTVKATANDGSAVAGTTVVTINQVSNGSSSGGSSHNTSSDTPKPADTQKPADTKGTQSQETKTFKDVDSRFDWAKDAIQELSDKGIISGTSENTFSPDKNITRADFLVLLVKALNLKADFSSNFTDVSLDSYYYDAIGIAKKLGIVTGTGANEFNPKAEISRQDMMVLIAKALKAAGTSLEAGSASDIKGFKDASKVADYAKSAVETLVKEGIIKGSGNAINPRACLTRAETAVVIYKICK